MSAAILFCVPSHSLCLLKGMIVVQVCTWRHCVPGLEQLVFGSLLYVSFFNESVMYTLLYCQAQRRGHLKTIRSSSTLGASSRWSLKRSNPPTATNPGSPCAFRAFCVGATTSQLKRRIRWRRFRRCCRWRKRYSSQRHFL